MASVQDVERFLEHGNALGLCRTLTDRNVLTRRRAVQALGELGSPEGVTALAAALRRNKDQYVVRWAIESLRQIGDEAAVEALADAAFGDHRQAAALASQALAAIQSPHAAAAFQIREMLQRNALEGFAALGEESRGALAAVLRSQQFANWPSGKRKPILMAAVRLGITPALRYRRDLIDMGLFVSGVHNVGDLLNGLSHPVPSVRAAAADRLGAVGYRWVTFALYNRFRRETRAGGDHVVALAAARALARLGDERGVRHYQQQLHGRDIHAAAHAVGALAEIGTPQALQILFQYGVEPPPPPAFRNVPEILAALESAGPAAFDVLKPLAEQGEPPARCLFAQVAARSRHPDSISLLTRLCQDSSTEVQQAGLDALAQLGTPEAAAVLYGLRDYVPLTVLLHPLAQIARPEAVAYLRQLSPGITSVHGTLFEDNGEPLSMAYVQIVQEHYYGEQKGWGWAVLTVRAETDSTGEFWLALLDGEAIESPRLKVTAPQRSDGKDRTFLAQIDLARGEHNTAKARIDRFISRLVVDVRVRPPGS